MDILQEQLGKTLTVEEVAKYLKIDKRTVRKYYLQLGGVRLGRAYRFFERSINDAIQAPWKMACTSENKRQDKTQIISQEKPSNRMGGRTKEKKKRIEKDRDPYNLLD